MPARDDVVVACRRVASSSTSATTEDRAVVARKRWRQRSIIDSHDVEARVDAGSYAARLQEGEEVAEAAAHVEHARAVEVAELRAARRSASPGTSGVRKPSAAMIKAIAADLVLVPADGVSSGGKALIVHRGAHSRRISARARPAVEEGVERGQARDEGRSSALRDIPDASSCCQTTPMPASSKAAWFR